MPGGAAFAGGFASVLLPPCASKRQSPRSVLYTPLGWPISGVAAMKDFIKEFHEANPGLRATLHDEFYSPDGARACFRFVLHFHNAPLGSAVASARPHPPTVPARIQVPAGHKPHFTGPTWQAKDGSQVKAARVDGVTVEPTAIPWLLLKATATTAGPRGDRLVRTSYIQRIATAGGLEPAAADCNSASLGTVRESPYTADYVSWKAKA